jgi:hypothetical protein
MSAWCVVCGDREARPGSLFCGQKCERDSIRYHEEQERQAEARHEFERIRWPRLKRVKAAAVERTW